MTKQAIRTAYTQKVTELLNQGYTLYPDTMNGTQGELAHIDLARGTEIVRVLLTQECAFRGFLRNNIVLTVGRATAEPGLGSWHRTVWNQRLEVLSQQSWAEVSDRGEGWYIDPEAGSQIEEKRRRRYPNQPQFGVIHTVKGGAFHTWAVAWVRRQPRMKSCKPEDVRIDRCTLDGRRWFQISAKGKTWTLGR